MGLDMYLRGSQYNSEHSHKGDIKRPMLENKYNIVDYQGMQVSAKASVESTSDTMNKYTDKKQK